MHELPLSLLASQSSSVGDMCGMTCGISHAAIIGDFPSYTNAVWYSSVGCLSVRVPMEDVSPSFHPPALSLTFLSSLAFYLLCLIFVFCLPALPFLFSSTSPCPSPATCPPRLHSHTSFDTFLPLIDLQLRYVVHGRLFTPTLGILINSGWCWVLFTWAQMVHGSLDDSVFLS